MGEPIDETTQPPQAPLQPSTEAYLPNAPSETRPGGGPPSERIVSVPIPEVPGYEIERELGRGGMGVVYRARQQGLNRTVALKMVLAGAHATEDELVRFLAEAETAARLQHQGIAQIYGIGRAEGLPYFAMEFVDGGSLADRLRTALSHRDAARIALDLAVAVGHAHASGIVHRDLKPANILLTVDGMPKVTDFGLAKRLEAGAGMTQTGSILGTPAYMPPEQARGEVKTVGPTGDVYSLGAVLYEMLTGQRPFRGNNAMSILSLVLNAAPEKPRSIDPSVPLDLETIALKCLEKDATKRYPTADALADDLRRYLDGRTISARRIGPIGTAWRWAKRNQTVAWLLGVVFGLLTTAAVGATIAAWQINLSAENEREALKQEKAATKAADEARKSEKAALIEVRRQVARLNASGFEIHTRQSNLPAALHWASRTWKADLARGDDYDPVAEADHRLRVASSLAKFPELIGLCLVGKPVLEMDCDSAGRYVVALVGDSSAQVWDAERGEPLYPPLAHDGRVTHARFSPDGTVLATASVDRSASLWIARTGRRFRNMPHSDPVAWLAFSSDGYRLVTAAGRNLTVWEVARGREIGIPIDAGSEVHFVAFSPDGKRLLAATTDETARVWDVATGKPLSDPLPQKQPTRPIEDLDDELHIQRRVRPEFSPDSQSVLLTDSSAAVLWSEKQTRRFPLPAEAELGFHGTFTPDGTRAIFYGRGRGVLDLWSLELATGRFTKIGAQFPRQLSGIQIPPTGSSCAIATTAGTVSFRHITEGNDFPSSSRSAKTISRFRFAADGKRLAIASRDGTVRVVAVPGTVPVPDYSFGCGRADRLNPAGYRYTGDGQTMAVETADGVRVSDRLGLTPPIVLGKPGATPVAFTPDGRFLIVVDRDGMTIWDWRTSRSISTVPAGPSKPMHCMLSRDGLKLGVLREDRSLEIWTVPTGERVFGPVTAPRKGAVAINPTGTRIAVVAFNDTIDAWDAIESRPLPGVNIKRDAVFYDTDFSHGSGRFATATTDLNVRQWDDRIERLGGPTISFSSAPPEYVGYTSDDRRLMIVDLVGALYVFNANSGQLLGSDIGGARVTTLPAIGTPTAQAPIAFANSWKCLWESRDGKMIHGHFSLAGPTVTSWRLPQYAAGLESVEPLAALISGYTADEEGNLALIDADEFLSNPLPYRRAWRSWRGLPTD